MDRVARAEEIESLVGQRHGPLVLERLLGVGASGTVYLARHPPSGVPFAVRVLHAHLADDPMVRSRFFVESSVITRVIHRHVARVLDARFGPNGLPCLLMEYIEGEPLSCLSLPMAPVQVVELLAQVLEGLEAAHARGAVHCDLKPDNLFLTQDKRGRRLVKVLDFGQASVLAASFSREELASGMALGSPPYMAPEQWETAAADARMDLYAMGVVGYRLLTGRLPFGRGRMGEVLLGQQEIRPPAPHMLDARVSRELSEVVMQALARRPDRRFPSARDFRLALIESLGPVARALFSQESSMARATAPSGVHARGRGSDLLAGQEAEPVQDSELAQLLARTAALGQDPYVLLGLPPSASFDEVRQRAEAALRRLEAFGKRPLPDAQRRELESLRSRVEKARRTIGEPLPRAGFDAQRGNAHGIARCIAAGLTEKEVEPLRRAYLASRPGTEDHALTLFTQGRRLESQLALKPALDCYAQALALDPLNLAWQRHYWALQRRMRPMTTSLPTVAP